jgi:hypothetical protein
MTRKNVVLTIISFGNYLVMLDKHNGNLAITQTLQRVHYFAKN